MTAARPARGAAAGAILAVTALLAAGCGGSEQAAQQREGGPAQAARGVRKLPAPRGAAAEIAPTRTQSARRQRGLVDDEISASAAKPEDPCALVSRAQAQAILGAATRAPVPAPQGPTCIYATRDARRQVTIAVQAAPGTPGAAASAIGPRALRDRMRVRVGARHAYCGVAGTPTLLMPLGEGRIIVVAAPCPVAAAFAADALSHASRSRH
jgi:hypothetical protein